MTEFRILNACIYSEILQPLRQVQGAPLRKAWVVNSKPSDAYTDITTD